MSNTLGTPETNLGGPTRPDTETTRIRRSVDFEPQLNEVRDRAQQLYSDVRELENRLSAIKNSTTWRLSEPIRRFVEKCKIIANSILGKFSILARTMRLRSDVIFRSQTLAHKLSTAIPTNEILWSLTEVSGTAVSNHAIPPNIGKQKLIFVSDVLAVSSEAGGTLSYQALHWAARAGWDITVVGLSREDNERSGLVSNLAALYPNFLVVFPNGKLLYRLRKGGAELHRLDGKVVGAFRKPQKAGKASENFVALDKGVLVAVLHELEAALKPEAVIVSDVFLANVFAGFSCDAQKTIIYGGRTTPKALYYSSIEQEEIVRLLKLGDVIVAADDDQKHALSKFVPNKIVVTASLSSDVFTPNSNPTTKTILLIASDAQSEVDGTANFLRFAWPIIRRHKPNVKLLVGGRVCKSIDGADPSIIRVGDVVDSQALYARASVIINPAMVGDVTFATLQAFAHLRPVVVWPHGMDRLDMELKPLCHIATNWYQFAVNVLAVLDNVSATSAIESQRDLILERLSPERSYAALGAVLGRAKV